MQQASSFAYTSSSSVPVTSLTFQPLISYQLGRGWYIKSSDATWTFNLCHTFDHDADQRRIRAGLETLAWLCD